MEGLAARLALALAALVAVDCGRGARDTAASAVAPPFPPASQVFAVTPAASPSVIARLGMSLENTRFGQNGGSGAPQIRRVPSRLSPINRP